MTRFDGYGLVRVTVTNPSVEVYYRHRVSCRYIFAFCQGFQEVVIELYDKVFSRYSGTQPRTVFTLILSVDTLNVTVVPETHADIIYDA